MKFKIYQDARGAWRWSLVAANNRIIADGSEGYASDDNVRRAIDTLRSFGDSLSAAMIDYRLIEKRTLRQMKSKAAANASHFGKSLEMLAVHAKKKR